MMTEAQAAVLIELIRENNGLLRRLLVLNGDEAVDRCPVCASTDLENTSAMGDKRATCRACSHSFTPEVP